MRTLVIDAATAACSVALFDGDLRIAHDFRLLGRGHAEHLVPMIAALPDRGRASRIVTALGPGSFTGVRVGLAAARALGFAWDAPVLGYPTLALVAAMARGRGAGARAFAVAMTGGHGEWFVQRFAADGAALTPPASIAAAVAAGTLGEGLIVGSEAQAAVARRGWGEALALLPDAGDFMLLGADMLTSDISPRYGRGPDARLPDDGGAPSRSVAAAPAWGPPDGAVAPVPDRRSRA